MGYSDTELRNAYLADEVARLQNEHHGLFAFANSNRPIYGIVPDPEPTLADLTDDDIDGAVAEFASQRGISITELGEQLLTLTGGARDSYSRATALVELAAMPGDEADALLGLAAKDKPKGKPFGLDDDEDEEDGEDDDDEEEDDDDETAPPKARKKRSRKAPRKFRRGQRVAAEGGEPGGGSGPSGEGEGGVMAASAPRRMLVRAGRGYETIALSEDQEWAEAEADRLIALAASRNVPSAFEVSPGTTGNVEEHYDFQVYDVGARDDGDPTDPDGGNTNAIIARLQRDHNQYFSPSKTYGANTTISPKSVAARQAAETRELAGGRRQNPITR